MVSKEGEELVIPSQPSTSGGPATAEIPKEPMTLRKKIIILAVVVVGVITGLLTYTIVQQVRTRTLHQKAQEEYALAMDYYDKAAKANTIAEKKKYYSEALERFRALIRKYGRDDFARKALVKGYLCRARLGVLNYDWKEAREFEQKAEKELKDLARRQKSGSELYIWTKRVKKELQEFEAVSYTHLTLPTKA